VSADNVSVNQARSILDDHGINGIDAKVQQRTSASGSVLLIQVGDQSVAKRQEVQEALATEAKVPTESVSVTSVSSTWGRSITEKAIRALIIFLILVALFIAWRLEWRMALSAIVAMLHDVLISIGVYSVLRFEVTPATVVAFLTILGFSLYDTIVVFDKVKDNAERFSGARMPYADVVNVSMNQVLMRSINTTIAAVLPVLSLLILGAGVLGATTLREFSLALLVGLITGSYSSIFIASPLLAMLKEREPRYRMYRGSHATGAELERLVLGGSPAARRDAARLRSDTGADEVVLAATPTTPQSLLTHPPRPRKKKRRTS
jgi:preprotein translocase subunit SecF